ncbi:hypothetical protein F4779DRAFT_598909 [Xylariaceae sp. FL0662B]|nr:hypothetical protein F4779DRAFT_598909 [Xylariaceae sp. FL0662B]
MAEFDVSNADINNKIHPFFSLSKTLSNNDNTSSSVNPATPVSPDPSCSPDSNSVSRSVEYDEDGEMVQSSGRRRKRCKTGPSNDSRTATATGRASRSNRQSRVSAGASIVNHFSWKNDYGTQTDGEPMEVEHPPSQEKETRLTQTEEPNPFSSPVSDNTAANRRNTSCSESNPKPRKLLKFNPKTGTIGSPPKPKSLPTPADSPVIKTNRKRGRKPKTLLIYVRYGDDDASRMRIGQKINDIFFNTQPPTPEDDTTVTMSTPPSSHNTDKSAAVHITTPEKHTSGKGASTETPKKKSTPKKVTHPFFLGKSKTNAIFEKQKIPEHAKRHTIFTSTPCSPKRLRPLPKFNIPNIGIKPFGGLKVPGAQHPAWPWAEIVHVRGNGDDAPPSLSTMSEAPSAALARERKAKGQQVQVVEAESILNHTVLRLKLEERAKELKALNDNHFQPPSPLLNIPERHFESGKALQTRVLPELRTLNHSSSCLKSHPAIVQAYDSIEQTLSAFDRSTCETTAWAQKYAPSAAERVLQSGREAELLRDWLQGLKVLSVHTGTTETGTKPKATAPVKKRRKRKKLDDFIVSSDDEADTMDDILEAENDWTAAGYQGNVKRTVVRSSDATSRRGSRDGGRLTNAVVLSGPHGCGKTATVYAIAKELDFEVFEINAGGRRNGKDILEKVGDMTRNHLVQHQQKRHIQDETVTKDHTTRDLKSGKQDMMTAFFKSKLTKVHGFTKEPDRPTSAGSSISGDNKRPPKAQKQSLILLEEVDILYEEDKQFWATVISMISQSRRPFIMTCNDETLVPLQNLNLHGIFRFSSPPKDLAVDLLLLIAATEGHALRRDAVETLYDSRGHDLRASITELNYWCQIGVGDEKGGFNWFYPRWPKGRDLDAEGERIRVVSQNTYQSGMGWLSRDSAADGSLSRSPEEELHQQSWQNWSFDMYEPMSEDDFGSYSKTTKKQHCSAQDHLALLESIDSFASLVSDVDIASTNGISPEPNQVVMDATIPNLPAKSKEDFIVGRQLLEVMPIARYDTTSSDITTSMRSLARARLKDGQPVRGAPDLWKPLNETKITSEIERHISGLLEAERPVTRMDYSVAFDPIAISEKVLATGYLDPSVFDRPMKTISLDVAPYVRSIVISDQQLQKERLLRSNILSEGGKPGKKRMRNTRSAYSALEGGPRASTRREKYFSTDVNPYLVMRTGGKGWDVLTAQVAGNQSVASSAAQSPEEPTDTASD